MLLRKVKLPAEGTFQTFIISIPGGEEEDVIHCICGIFRDEGVMIQCERCLVWQHCYCVKANGTVENYLCERCSPREVDYEIPSQEEASDPTQTNYITLLRGDMQLKQGNVLIRGKFMMLNIL